MRSTQRRRGLAVEQPLGEKSVRRLLSNVAVVIEVRTRIWQLCRQLLEQRDRRHASLACGLLKQRIRLVGHCNASHHANRSRAAAVLRGLLFVMHRTGQ